jgi:uncharacterized protein YsxB (DUF464 family)
MIDICFSEIALNKIEFIIKGHSSNNKGKDIVCSAVSALAQTFLRGIENNLKAKFQGKFLSGDCDLIIEVPNKFSQEFKIVCNIFKEGFHKISESYPEQVNLN